MKNVSLKALGALEMLAQNSEMDIHDIELLEEEIDNMAESYRRNQMIRMQKGLCSDEACVLYSEMLTDFERIGDHILNIGQEMGRGKVGA